MTSRRLALVTRRYWPQVGGAERAMANLAGELRRLGDEVQIVTAQWDPQWPREVVHREVPVIRLPQPRVRWWGTMRYMHTLMHWLDSQRPKLDGVIVSMLKHDAWCAVRTFRDSNIPVLLRAEGGGSTGDMAWQRTALGGSRIRRMCHSANALIAPSPAVQEELLQAGYSSSKVRFIPNGVECPPPRTAETRMLARYALREANHDLTLDERAHLAVYTGRLDRNKGLRELVKAWAKIALRWPLARLWLVGEGPMRDELWELISDYDLRYRVCLPGAFDEVGDILAAADLFVLPSYEEGLSLALLEALAMGLPAVASDIPGNRLAAGDAASYVPVRDVTALAEGISRLFDSAEQRRSLGQAGRERVAAQFGLTPVAKEHQALIDNASR
jgi:glycosyltransferase involved in cell wall biosynthesis